MRVRLLPILASLVLVCLYRAAGQETTEGPYPSASQNENLRDLASRILKNAPEAGCLAHECKILVVNFAMPSGVNPAYGSVLADEFSTQLGDLQKEVQIFNRGLLKTYAAVVNTSANLPKSDKDAREFAGGLGASAVVIGSATKLPDNTLKLAVRLLSVGNSSSDSHTEEAIVPPAPEHLPAEIQVPALSLGPGASAAPPPFPSGNKNLAVPGKNGVSIPSCLHMPNPPYTKEAKDAKFSGTVFAEGIIGVDGKLTHVRILKPVGLGMDETIVKTMKSWTCKPAIGPNGKPIPVIVPFEINFRLY